MAIITLSRGTYSGAKELAEYTAENLGYRLLSRENIVDELAGFGWEDEKLKKLYAVKSDFLQGWTYLRG